MQNSNESKLQYIIIILLIQSFLLLFCWLKVMAKGFPTLDSHEIFKIVLEIILFIGLGLSIMTIIIVKETLKLMEHEMNFKVKEVELEKNKKMIKSLKSQKHDFANHLQTLYGMAQLNKKEKAKEYIESVNEDLAKLKFSKTNEVNSILESILVPKKLEAQEVGFDFEYHVDAGIKNIHLSLDKVFRVISNLVDNALDATKDSKEQGKIRVTGEDWEEEYVLSVYNNGPPIEEDLVDKIFESGFSTKGNERGYGLHIIKSLVEEAQGELEINSEEGYGTEFVCYFPKRIGVKKSS